MIAPHEIAPKCPNCRNSMWLEAEVMVCWNGQPYVIRRRRCSCRRYLTTIQAAMNFRGRVKDLPDITGYRNKASVYEANLLLGVTQGISLVGAPETSTPALGPGSHPAEIVDFGANGEAVAPTKESEEEHAVRN